MQLTRFTRWTTPVALAITLLTAIGIGTAQAQAGAVHSVTGSGSILFTPGMYPGIPAPFLNNVSISAYQYADGSVSGSAVWTSEGIGVNGTFGGLQSTGWPWTIAIDTLVIDPNGLGMSNQALVSGIVTNDPQGDVTGTSFVGGRVFFYVTDNGNNPSTPDYLSVGFASGFVKGNFTVK